MTSTSSAKNPVAARQYSSPLSALVWSFRKSRDNWKRKCLDAKAQLKRALRRLDRLHQKLDSSPPATRPSPPARALLALQPTATSAAATPVAQVAAAVAAPSPASLPLPSVADWLHTQLHELHQHTQENRRLLEEGQAQALLIADLSRLIRQHLDGTATPCHASAAPLPCAPQPSLPQGRCPRLSASTEQPQPLPTHQEPKKGAPRRPRG
jgi:hypothetical protein